MKLLFLAALLLCASCAPPPRPYSNPAAAGPYENRSGPLDNRSAPAPSENRPASAATQQNAADCERKAALSASAGGRAEAFNTCMKARTSN
jgi:hypothetical protein